MRYHAFMEKSCDQCGRSYRCKPSHAERRRFCSKRCLGISNGERLQAQRAEYAARTGSRNFGVEPWSKTHAKGRHLSPASEFKRGQRPANLMPVGSVTIRKTKSGRRAFVKVAEPNRWKERATVVWEATHGPLRKGRVVHHRDRNPLNDELSNLEALTRAQHAEEHQQEIARRRWPRAERRV